MKKIKRLSLNRETLRALSVDELVGANGGLSGNRCTVGQTGCAACGGGNSLGNTACNFCATEANC